MMINHQQNVSAIQNADACIRRTPSPSVYRPIYSIWLIVIIITSIEVSRSLCLHLTIGLFCAAGKRGE